MGFGDGSGISWTICKQSAPRSRQIITPTPDTHFFQAGCSFWCQTNCAKPVWARGRCRISPPRFLAECCKRQLNQRSLVLLYFRLFTFSDLYWVCLSVFSCTVLFVSISQVINPSVLWHCWLGGRKGIRPVKTEWWVLAWLSVWSEMQTCIWPSWCHCHSLSLASVKSRLVLPFWYRLTQVVLDKGPFKRVYVYQSSDWLWRPPPKWPILCRMGR